MDSIKKMVYKPLKQLTDSEIFAILEHGNINDLSTLPLTVGEHHPDWKFAQNVCVRLSDHNDAMIRANAMLGFAYIARTKGKLDKNIVKPIILRELKENKFNKGRITDAIDDIKIFMKWDVLKG